MGEQSSENPVRVESVLELDDKTRALERVRLTNEMRLINVGTSEKAVHTPIELLGDAKHAIAFLDLVQASTPPDQLSVVLSSQTNGLQADSSVAQRLNDSGGIIEVRGGGSKETTVVDISQDPDGTFHCKFGHSARGTTIERGANKSVNIYINADPNSIIDESAYKLYKITGNPNYAEVIGIRAEMRGRGAARAVSQAVDPESHYATLGLNPYSLRFLSEETFEAAVKGIKRGISSKLHPDVAQPSPEEVEYLKRMLAACSILEDRSTRESYSRWLK